MRMATAVLSNEGSETLDGGTERFDKPSSSTGSGGGSRSSSDLDSMKDVEMYVKFFTLKSVQVIIQSRLGKKIKADSKPCSTGKDWFNIQIEDNVEILEATKDILKSQSSEIPIVIEISLQSMTEPNAKLTLELWSILYDKGSASSPDNSPPAAYSLYNRLGVLLKSLLCVTRSLPAYKLSRKLSLSDEDDYKLHYNVFSAISLFSVEPVGFSKLKGKELLHGALSPLRDAGESGMLHEYIDYGNVLGEGYKFNQLGQIVTPYGMLTLELAYRTKMELSSNFSQGCSHFIVGTPTASHINNLMIKSDHYAIENALQDSPGQQGIVRQRNRSTPVTFGGIGRENIRPLVPGSPKYVGSPSSSPVTTTKRNLAAAFVDDATLFIPNNEEADFDDTPLGNLLKKSMLLQKGQQQQEDESAKNIAQDEAENCKTQTNEETVILNTEQDESTNGFEVIDMSSLPLAAGSGSGTHEDLMTFFQHCHQTPESLKSVSHPPSNDDSINIITDNDLKSFESEMVIFDDFVKKLILADQSTGE